MFRFEPYAQVPERGGRLYHVSGGLVEVEEEGASTVVWGVGGGGLYIYDQVNKVSWKRVADGGEKGARLAVCGGSLVAVGGGKDDMYRRKVMVWREGRWSLMSHMLVGCSWPCVVSVGRCGLVVMGGRLGDGGRRLNDVQVFNGQTWHVGPSLPQPCWAMSAVVYRGHVVVMGGYSMDRAVWCADINDLTTPDKQKSIWTKLPDVPYHYSTVCVVGGMLLAIGGNEDMSRQSTSTSAIYEFHCIDQTWKHAGEMSHKCSDVDTLLLSGGGLLVVDGHRQQVLKIEIEPSPKELRTDAKALYEEAITKGYVETSVTKCLILGAAGVGKTHLKHLLLKKDPPDKRVSTGLADNPVRAISFTLTGVGGQEEDEWFVVDDDQALLKLIGGTIKGGLSIAPSLANVVSTLPKMTINVPGDGADVCHSDPTPAGVNTTRTSALQEELIQLITHSSAEEKGKLFNVKWIQFIDSGGQLQYHDILPLFIHNTPIILFVINLSEDLSHHPTIEYYGADGTPVGKLPSSLSHKQILQHCLGAIKSQARIITIGTHRDITHECSESIKKKNQQLEALLDCGNYSVLYKGEALKQVIFPVNGKAPQDEDRCVANFIRQEIAAMSPQSIKMPIAWFGLEVFLRKSSYDGILSLNECQLHARRLQIEGDAFSAALYHLVHHNVFLYYPEVLPQTVFCDPQVVLTKVSELVQYLHKLNSDEPDEAVAVRSELVMFKYHGLLSVTLLEMFPKHYKKGLFTAKDLLKILVSVHAIAKIKDGEYLMPALLPHLDSTQMSKDLQQNKSLIIKPTQGCIPSGLFCCLVAHLLSPNTTRSWKVCMKKEKPLCLYRNCISFILKDAVEIVTLVDMFSYIHISVEHVGACTFSEVCREIRGYVYSGITSVCSALKYDVQFQDAFMCAGPSCTSESPHLAVVLPPRSSSPVYKWKCTLFDDQNGDLSEDQLMWLGESDVTKLNYCPSVSPSLVHSYTCKDFSDLLQRNLELTISTSSCIEHVMKQLAEVSTVSTSMVLSSSSQQLSQLVVQAVPQLEGTPTLKELLSFSSSKLNIAVQVGGKYSQFGIFLLEDSDGVIVNALEMEHHWKAELINMAILQKWLQGKGVKPVTWSTLVAVLQNIGM